MNLKLSIKSIIKWEQLTSKSFNNINYSDNDEMMKLLYCMVLCNNDELFDYEEFNQLIENKKLSKEIFTKFSKILKNIEQFTEKSESKIEEDEQVEDSINEVQFIKDIAALLIIQGGLGADYVMNEMEITDISYYMKAYNNRIKEQMESNRLWCYMSILPHIDSHKCDSPSKFYPFPWEIETIKKEEKQTIQSVKDEFEMMMKNNNKERNNITNG